VGMVTPPGSATLGVESFVIRALVRETVDWARYSGPRRYFVARSSIGPIVPNESRLEYLLGAKQGGQKGLATDTVRHSDCHENPARPPFLSQAGRCRQSFPVGQTW